MEYRLKRGTNKVNLTPEQLVCMDIESLLNRIPRCAYKKVYVGGYKGRRNPAKGLLDYVCCIKGRAVYIDAKSKYGTLEDSQKEFIMEFERAGALCIVAYSSYDVERELRKEGLI